MSSLYQIETELLEIFNNIEANDGEITDEQYNKLLITEENFKEKLKSYHKAIQVFTGEMAACKDEEKRIAEYRKVRENRIKRLKASVLDAVILFGNTGKSGNKTIELDTFKAFTKSTQSVNVNENRIERLLQAFCNLHIDMIKEGAINYGEKLDIAGILASINAQFKANNPEFVEYTMDDLDSIIVEVSTKQNLSTIIENMNDFLFIAYLSNIPLVFTNNTPKEEFKNAISNEKDITVAEVVTNQNIQFK